MKRPSVTYVCEPDLDTVTTPHPECAQRAKHTPCPEGYIAWHDWAALQYAAGGRQRRCPGCGRYVTWSPRRRTTPETPATRTQPRKD